MKQADVGTKMVIPQPFAENGDRRTFSAVSASDVANFPVGIPSVYSLDMKLGGKHAERQDVNGIGYMATQPYFHLQNGELNMYSADVATAIDGYPSGACLWYRISATLLVIIESQVDDNKVAPTANTVDVKSDSSGNPDPTSGVIRWKTLGYRSDLAMFDEFYPVGSIYMNIGADLPSSFYGTWERIASGMCLWGANETGSDVNTTKTAGLPNITGTYAFGDRQTSTKQQSGALYDAGTFTNYRDGDGYSDTVPILGFDASKSNSIYGNSTTVQPPALVVSIWKRTA